MTPFHQLNNTAKIGRINEFRVWRAAQAVDWECTAHELAEELGIHVNTVWKICQRRGWTDKLQRGPGGVEIRACDVAMKYGVMG